ncbi:GNAT family N-acetyltransferase [Catenuloplanes sp. NPDC051500]|uniref:GNAT family N-acetyltransferase n=1 Tax=Catenuloplanes sp. NPDC051500 TaxID=3363959 RepID=UPI0037ADEA67
MINCGTRVYARNAAAMFRALDPGALVENGCLRVDLPTVTRFLVTRPISLDAVAGLAREAPPGKALVVEDLMHAEAAPVEGVRTFRIPVMVRGAGPVDAPRAPVVEVTEPGELAETERLIIGAFPLANYQPPVTGNALPARVLDIPGWRVWLARAADGTPAAGCFTYDDGASVGFYWVATHPEHRGRGLGRAVMEAALAAHPEREATLVATDAGLPLYEKLGFRPVSTMTWYTRQSVIDARNV